jgi:hypothetical protein
MPENHYEAYSLQMEKRAFVGLVAGALRSAGTKAISFAKPLMQKGLTAIGGGLRAAKGQALDVGLNTAAAVPGASSEAATSAARILSPRSQR